MAFPSAAFPVRPAEYPLGALRVGALRAVLACAALTLAGCSALPDSGPSTDAVFKDAAQTAPDGATAQNYEIADVDQTVIEALSVRSPASLAKRFGDYRPPVDTVIGVGDVVRITIWEAGSGGLFAAPPMVGQFSTGANSATIPDQSVGRDGTITVPFAGRIRAAGLSPASLQSRIATALVGKASQPQVLATIVRQVSADATVVGESTGGAVVPLAPGGTRILDAIAQAGGIHTPLFETEVRLSRGGRTEAVPVSTIVSNPRENVYLRPGDTIALVRKPRNVLALGATGGSAQIPFDSDHMTLADALAKAGGLQDYRADPAGVFVFRYESNAVAGRLRPGSSLVATRARVPFVYRLNLRQAQNLLLAQHFPMFDGDVLYVSNSPYVSVAKATQIFANVAQPVTTAASVRSALK
ncbi:MAG: polysaccharide export protein [Hyphomicrobiales bacterium]|nr:polysaccharide export protein [Hyphomicrobiales bacterium]MDE2017612.1 polysaccharide export protein [Hyphomicrobiales bacterium]